MGATDVNAGPPSAVMMSVGDIARRDGVSTPAVSRRVKQLRERHGLQVELDRNNRVVAVNVAHYDELVDKHGDPSKVQAPTKPTGETAAPEDATYNEALRRKTLYEAERGRLRLEEDQGKLVRVDALADALSIAGEKIVRSVDRIMAGADDLAAAVARDGTAGVRAELKKLAHQVKADIADALAEIADAAPEVEPEE